jgi:hypothetical protein
VGGKEEKAGLLSEFEVRGFPPFRQKKGERMGHGAFLGFEVSPVPKSEAHLGTRVSMNPMARKRRLPG